MRFYTGKPKRQLCHSVKIIQCIHGKQCKTYMTSVQAFIFFPLLSCSIFVVIAASDMQFSARKALEVLHNVYHKQGFRALYRGNSATMCRIIPYAAIQYASHEQYKKLLNPSNAP